MKIERERKFSISDSRNIIPRFYELSFVDGYERKIGWGDRVSGAKYEDIYFDTGDFHLLNIGASYRARRFVDQNHSRHKEEFSGVTFTFKTKFSGDEREEITDRIDDNSYSAFNLRDSSLNSARRAREILGNRGLREIIKLMTERRTIDFFNGENEFEVALDYLTYLHSGGEVIDSEWMIEVEQTAGTANEFARFSDSIGVIYGGSRINHNKYAAGVRLMQRKA